MIIGGMKNGSEVHTTKILQPEDSSSKKPRIATQPPPIANAMSEARVPLL